MPYSDESHDYLPGSEPDSDASTNSIDFPPAFMGWDTLTASHSVIPNQDTSKYECT